MAWSNFVSFSLYCPQYLINNGQVLFAIKLTLSIMGNDKTLQKPPNVKILCCFYYVLGDVLLAVEVNGWSCREKLNFTIFNKIISKGMQGFFGFFFHLQFKFKNYYWLFYANKPLLNLKPKLRSQPKCSNGDPVLSIGKKWFFVLCWCLGVRK